MLKQRYIVHVDMDAFFASVEQRDKPEYRLRPVVVGADPEGGKGRGVVSACSYEARKFGIHSAMPISKAYRRCPEAVFLPVDMPRYSEVSRQVFRVLEGFTPDVEPVSIDEAFLDITGSYHLFGTPVETCAKIKRSIREVTGLTASVGMAPNKMTAKIASDVKKPDGLVVVGADRLEKFLHPLPVDRLWGVGAESKKVLNSVGIHLIGDLASRKREDIHELLGANGVHLWELANGVDPRDVQVVRDIMSVSNEHTFAEDTADRDMIKDILMRLSEKVSRRMRKDGLKGRTITLKLRLEDFTTYTRSVTVPVATNYADEIYASVLKKAGEFFTEGGPVRLVGVKVSNLTDPLWPDDLFTGTGNGRRENIHKALDRIHDRFGESSIRRRCP